MERKSLSFKLNISITILLILILAAGIYSIFMINKSQSYAQETGENWLPSVKSVSRISDSFGNTSRRHVAVLGDYATNQSTEIIQTDKDKLNGFIKTLNDRLDAHKKLADSPEEKALLDSLIASWNETYAQMQLDLQMAESEKSKEAFLRFNEKTLPLFFKTTDLVDKLSKINTTGAIGSTKLGSYFTSLTNIIMAIIVTISVLISLMILQIIKKSTNAITTAIENLKIQSVSTGQIASDLKKGSRSLSESVTEQASSVHETSAAINQITSMVNRTAENAKESTNVARSASEKAEEGQITMKKLVSAMETIQESNAQLQNIAGIINQINTKTAVINDIVSKTELLSLNASIESARAGEYGKGFAVVAEEVGNLAKVSGKAAHEIQELITSSQEQVNTILGLTKERVDEGKKVTAEAQESFSHISEDISNMSTVIQQISDATREQEIGVRQISTAMSNIDRATQNSQSAVNTTAESANILVGQSEKLDQTTKDVEFLIAGSNK
jgi:methyl-accepting chemotaxis protein